jgi:hypothetical protein
MKIYLLTIAILGFAQIGSCNLTGSQPSNSVAGNSTNSSSSGGTNPSQAAGDGQIFTAVVDGKPFSGKNIHATVTNIGGKAFFNITAFSHDINYNGANKDEKIGLNIEGEIKPGDYQFGDMGKLNDMHSHGAYNSGSADNDMAPENSYSITGGKLTITKYDDRSKSADGTFTLSAANKDGKTVKIENGQFSHINF